MNFIDVRYRKVNHLGQLETFEFNNDIKNITDAYIEFHNSIYQASRVYSTYNDDPRAAHIYRYEGNVHDTYYIVTAQGYISVTTEISVEMYKIVKTEICPTCKGNGRICI